MKKIGVYSMNSKALVSNMSEENWGFDEYEGV